jgi:osmotically-inducible protein OsmY
MRERDEGARKVKRERERRPRDAELEGDRQLLVACQGALAADPALVGCLIGPGTLEDEARRRILGTEGLEGRISIEVKAGTVVLDGEVPSLLHKRLAGVLVRRSAGCRGVVNRLSVELPQQDSDEERETAVRLALTRASSLDPRDIRVRARGSTVTLEGRVDSPLLALAAETAAASVFGVERVENRLVVDPGIRGKA